jgi:hypothetical protein
MEIIKEVRTRSVDYQRSSRYMIAAQRMHSTMALRLDRVNSLHTSYTKHEDACLQATLDNAARVIVGNGQMAKCADCDNVVSETATLCEVCAAKTPTLDALEVRQGFADGLLTDCDNCGRTMRNGGDCVCDDDNPCTLY